MRSRRGGRGGRIGALGLGLLLLAGAAGAEPTPGGPLVLWHAYRGRERAAFERTIGAWNRGGRGKHPPLRVLAVPYDAFADKIGAAIPRGHGPDLFVFAHDRVADWARAGVVEPIEFWMDERRADRFIFATIDALCDGDSLYGLPLAFKTTALLYNRALVRRPPRTGAELLALGRRLTDRARGRFGLVYDNRHLYFHAAWLFGFGGRLFDARGRPDLDNAGARRALTFSRGLTAIMPPEVSGNLTGALLGGGKAAMAISGPWLLAELPRGLRLGVAPLPRVGAKGRPAAPFFGAEALMMSARSRRKGAAFAAMDFLTSDAMALVRALRARQPVANRAPWKDPRLARDRVLAAFRTQLRSAVPMPAGETMRLIWGPYDAALSSVVEGRAPPAEALRAAQREVTRLLRAAGSGGGRR